MNKMGIIIKEVYRKNVMSASFLMMVLGPVLMILVIGLIGYFIGKSTVENSFGNIGVINPSAEIRQLLDSEPSDNDYFYYSSNQEAQEALFANDIDGYLTVEEADNQIVAKYYRESTSKDIDVNVIKGVFQQYYTLGKLTQAGIDPNVLAQIEAYQIDMPTVTVQKSNQGQVIENTDASEEKLVRTGVAYVVSFVVYLFIMMYVGIISQEIAVEKGSRIMEIILSSITPTKHFLGKMLGIGLVILTQIVIYLGLFFLVKTFGSELEIVKQLPFDINQLLGQSGSDLALGGLFAFMGILIYSTLAAFLGSLVSRTEDVNKVVSPLIILGVVGFYIGMYALTSTNNPIVRIGSYVPFFTPFVMPFRVAALTVENWELMMTVVLSLIFVVLCLAISTIFYKSNVLATSDKGVIQTFKRSYQLWKTERSK